MGVSGVMINPPIAKIRTNWERKKTREMELVLGLNFQLSPIITSVARLDNSKEAALTGHSLGKSPGRPERWFQKLPRGSKKRIR